MKEVYLKEVRRTEAATPSYYTYDDYVKAGMVLEVHSCAVTWSNMGTNETGQFFIEDGGIKCFFGEDTPDRQGGHAYWQGKVFAGEHDRVGVYTPNSAAADRIIFTIVGVLWDRDTWRAKGS